MPKLKNGQKNGDVKQLIFEHLDELIESKKNRTHTELCKELGISRGFCYQTMIDIGIIEANKRMHCRNCRTSKYVSKTINGVATCNKCGNKIKT